MRSVKFLLTAAAVSFSTMAFASDLPIAAPPVYAPPADFGGWYLRGDIGMTNQSLSRIDSTSASLKQLMPASPTGSPLRLPWSLPTATSISDPPGPEHLPRSMQRPGPPRLGSRASPPMT